jgi:hypothetical protein
MQAFLVAGPIGLNVRQSKVSAVKGSKWGMPVFVIVGPFLPDSRTIAENSRQFR